MTRSPDLIWQETLDLIQPQMTPATFETLLAGTRALSLDDDRLTVGVKNEAAKEWLDNRPPQGIERAVLAVLGRPVEVAFEVRRNGAEAVAVEVETPAQAVAAADYLPDTPTGDDAPTPGQIVAGADYYAGFFERGGAGFSLLSHHTSYFWMALLDSAFLLWKILDSDDKRPLKSIKPNYWTPPAKYSYEELARRLNRKHGRYISGDTLECDRSRQARKAGQPIEDQAGCCLSENYERMRLTPHHTGEGLVCKHWSRGLLEILHGAGLAAVELNPGERKPTIQLWRMLPVIAPAQYQRFTAELQSDYDRWLDDYGHLFGIPDRSFWRAIEEPLIAPLMPGREGLEIEDNFEQREVYQDFLNNSFENPNFAPCM